MQTVNGLKYFSTGKLEENLARDWLSPEWAAKQLSQETTEVDETF